MTRIVVCDCDGAEDSLAEALTHVKPDRQLKALAATKVLRETLSSQGQLSSEKFVPEGTLPNGKHFYALKTTKAYSLRGYGFFAGHGTFWISHWVFKKWQKLKKADENRVIENWRKIVGADE